MKAASASPLKTTHFLTLHAPVEGKPFVAGKGNYGVRQIFAVPDGGWVDGLIKGKLVSPSGDWMRLSDKGIATLDVRTAILTDDDEPATIYVQYFGKIQFSAEIGVLMTDPDAPVPNFGGRCVTKRRARAPPDDPNRIIAHVCFW